MPKPSQPPTLQQRFKSKLCVQLYVVVYSCTLTTVNAADSQLRTESTHRSNAGAELVLRALGLLGVNYRFGGNTPEAGLDCSGLVRHVFREAAGLILPRRSEEISRTGETVQIDQLKPGDLVFFNTLRQAFSHVGIYIGNNQFVHAPSTGGQVRVESLSTNYWSVRYNGARRVVEGQAPSNGAPARDGQDAISQIVEAAATGAAKPVVATGSAGLMNQATQPATSTADDRERPKASGGWSTTSRWANKGAVSRTYADGGAREPQAFDQLMNSLGPRNRANAHVAGAGQNAALGGSARASGVAAAPAMPVGTPAPAYGPAAASAIPTSGRSPVDPTGGLAN